MIINTSMKINYKLEIDFVKAEPVGDFDNVVYNVGYDIRIWEGSKTLNQVLSAWEKEIQDGDNFVPCPVINCGFVERFEFDPEIAEGGFTPITELTTEILIDWLLSKYDFKTIEEFYPVKNAINSLKEKTEINSFTPVIKSISV